MNNFVCIILSLSLIVFPLVTTAENKLISIGYSVSAVEGDYGLVGNIDETTQVLKFGYATNQFVTNIKIPIIDYTAPTYAVSLVRDEVVVSGSTGDQGIGDVVVDFSWLNVGGGNKYDYAIDFTTSIKLANGDQAKNLGTGEIDYSFYFDIYRFYSWGNISTSLGYTLVGEPDGIALDDVWSTHFSFSRNISRKSKINLSYYHQPSKYDYADALQELTTTLSFHNSKNLYTSVYLLKGLSDSSPNKGTGVSFLYTF